MSKITTKTKVALANAKSAHVAKTAVKAGAKSAAVAVKAEKQVALHASVKALKAGSTMIAMLTTGADDCFRRVKYLGKGQFQLVQNNVGLSYDGATFTIDAASGKLVADKQGRLEAGNYICSRGERASVRLMSEAQATKLASKAITVRRNGHDIALKVTRTDAQYAASVEKLGKGGLHFFQWESVKLGLVNVKHYGSLVKG